MLPFALFYSLALVVLGLAQHHRLRYDGAALLLFVAALIGYTDWLFFAVALGCVLLTAWMRLRPGPLWLNLVRGALWLVISALLFAHAVPGYQGLVVMADSALKANSIASSLYFNHDKCWSPGRCWPLCRCFAPAWKPGHCPTNPSPSQHSPAALLCPCCWPGRVD